MAEDRSKQYLKAVKDTAVVAVGAIGTGTVDIDGLPAGTKAATGDYKAVFDADNTKKLSETASDPADVPGFLVLDLPGAPKLAATAGDAKIDYTITAPENDGAPSNGSNDITKYTVSYTPASGGKATTVDVSDPLKLTGTINGLTNDTEYTLTVTATNPVGEGPASAAVKATPKAAVVK